MNVCVCVCVNVCFNVHALHVNNFISPSLVGFGTGCIQ